MEIKQKQGEKIINRIDLQMEIEPVAFDDMADKTPAEPSASMREHVTKARAIEQILKVSIN